MLDQFLAMHPIPNSGEGGLLPGAHRGIMAVLITEEGVCRTICVLGAILVAPSLTDCHFLRGNCRRPESVPLMLGGGSWGRGELVVRDVSL